jgi:hypothetical protein
VPDDGRGAEGDDVARLLEAPAEVHVVAGLAVIGIEAADEIERPAMECHVAAGDVLGHHVGEQHVARSARCGSDARLDPVLRRRRDVRPAHAGVFARQQRAHEIIEPVGVGHAVAVRVGDDLARARGGAGVARVAQAHVFLPEVDEIGQPRPGGAALSPRPLPVGHEGLRVVGRTIVHEDDFVIRVIHPVEGLEAVAQGLAAVVGADDDGDARVARERHALGHRLVAGEEAPDGGECLLRFAFPGHQAEGPVGDLGSAAEPLVGPGVDDRPGQPPAHDALDVPLKHLALLVLGVADGVHPELTEDERPVLREVLQASEVSLEVGPAVQVDVESEEVGVLRQEVFRGGKTGVGVEDVGVFALGPVDQFLEELGDALGSEPAHHVAGDLVADEVAEDGGVAAVGVDRRDDGLLDLTPDLPLVEELDVLGPRDGDEAADAVLRAGVEEPPRRHIVDAHEVDARVAHQREVGARFVRRAEMHPLRVGREWSVGRALDEKLAVALEEKLGLNADRSAEIHTHSARGRLC